MTFDKEIMYRKTADGDLNATGQTAYFVHGEMPIPLWVRITVPAVTGVNPTLDIVVEESDNSSTVKEKHQIPQITQSGEYFIPVKFKRLASRMNMTLAGTSPNFGAVQIGLVPADRSKKGTWPEYILNDQFTVPLGAGAINGTNAIPKGGKRTVTDTGSKITITTGGVLNFATGETANDGIWFTILSRLAGRIHMAKIVPADANGIINFGWDTDLTGAVNDRLIFAATGILQIAPNGGTAIAVGAFTATTTYYVAGVMRGTGFFWYIKGGAFVNWTLLYITAAGTAALAPALTVGSTTAIFTADDMRVPEDIYLPTPLQSDGFSVSTTDGQGNAENNGPVGSIYVDVGTWAAGAGIVQCSVLAGGVGAHMLNTPSPDVIIDAAVTRSAGNAGIIARYESSTDYIIAYHDGTNAICAKVVAGSPTTLLTAAVAYSAGSIMRLMLHGTLVRLWYNNTAVQTNGVAPVSNQRRHGLYTTNIGNTFDNLVIWPRGVEAQHAALDLL